MRKLKGLSVLFVLLIALPACGDKKSSDTTASTEPAAAVSTVDMTATEYSYDTKAEKVKAGIVTVNLTNNGKEKHEAAVLQIPTGKTLADVLKDLEPVVTSQEGVPIPDTIQPVGGVNELDAGKSTSVKVALPAGNYVFLCTLTGEDGGPPPSTVAGQTTTTAAPKKPHFTQGMVKPFEVAGDAGPAQPTGDVTLTAKEYSFDVPKIAPGKHTIAFKNDGPKEIHVAVILGFPVGTSTSEADRIVKSFADPNAGPPAIEPKTAGSSAVQIPGTTATFEGDFPAGTYTVICFLNDRAGGPPHVNRGMYKSFTVA
jgi:hypothetical protein